MLFLPFVLSGDDLPDVARLRRERRNLRAACGLWPPAVCRLLRGGFARGTILSFVRR